MSGALGGVLVTFGWTLIAYGALMLFDLMAFNRIGMAVIYPDWMEAVEPRFWVKVAPRHFILIPTAFLLQDLIRRHAVDLSPASISCIVLGASWAALLVWDSLRYYVYPILRAKKAADLQHSFARTRRE